MKNSLPAKYLIYAEDDIDDQEIMRDMIGRIDPSLKVITVNNGLELLQYLIALEPDEFYPCFIVLDINMPVWDGIRTLKSLKADPFYNDIPVIMFSTSSMQKDMDLATSLGAEQFITKPLRQAEMEAVTEKFAHYCKQLPLKKKKEHA